jgi:hypothetical protein
LDNGQDTGQELDAGQELDRQRARGGCWASELFTRPYLLRPSDLAATFRPCSPGARWRAGARGRAEANLLPPPGPATCREPAPALMVYTLMAHGETAHGEQEVNRRRVRELLHYVSPSAPDLAYHHIQGLPPPPVSPSQSNSLQSTLRGFSFASTSMRPYL